MIGIDRDLIEFYKKLSNIRNNYTLKKLGKLTLEENALIKYDDLCVDLIKENQKSKEVIKKVSTRLEYYLIGNLKYESSQKEFIKLLDILKEVE